MTTLRTIDSDYLPRILIIDDQYGRSLRDGTQNDLRHTWRRTRGLMDVTGDASASSTKPQGKTIARAVFFSGQTPSPVGIGDKITNDLPGILEAVRKGWHCTPQDRWACVLVDLQFVTGTVTEKSSQDESGAPSGNQAGQAATEYFGLDIIEAIKTQFPDLPVAILSSNKKDQDLISERYEGQGGVKVFIDKQCSREELQNHIWDEGLVPANQPSNIGLSLSLLKALRIARKAASTRTPVLIQGPSGTGKEPLAAYLMQWSAKLTNGPQLPFNCAELETEIGGSQLFGHIKGAFTSAFSDKKGLFEVADGGDLFLDEIHQMKKEAQSRLLKIIENGRLTRLGEDADKFKQVDVRVICGTNVDLESRVQQGSFLHDLLFRLRVITIDLPPLCERFEDLELIVNGLISKYDQQEEPRKRRIGNGLLRHLTSYSWPGNIRELSNMVQRACVLDREARHLLPRDMPLPVAAPKKLVSSSNPPIAGDSVHRESVHEVERAYDSGTVAFRELKTEPQMSVAEFVEFLENVHLTAESDEELRGLFSSSKDVLGKYEKASQISITRLVLLALEKCVSEGDARKGNYNFRKAIRLLVNAEVGKTKFDQFVTKHMLLSSEGPVGDQFREALDKKTESVEPIDETTV